MDGLAREEDYQVISAARGTRASRVIDARHRDYWR
jgi:hypothetical protein